MTVPSTPEVTVLLTSSLRALLIWESSDWISDCMVSIAASRDALSSAASSSPSRTFSLALTSTSSMTTPAGTVISSSSTSASVPEPVTVVLMLPRSATAELTSLFDATLI